MYTASWSKDGNKYQWTTFNSYESASAYWESMKKAGYKYGGVQAGSVNPNENNFNNKPSIPPILIYGGIVALILYLRSK